MKGKLVVVEGLDGSGKHTQAELLYRKIKSLGHDSFFASFPDYGSPSSSLVKMYLNSEFGDNPSAINAYAVSSFFAVDRYASYMRSWRESYLNGAVIVCDRYTTSNAVYRLSEFSESLKESYIEWLYDYEYDKLGLPRPDVVIYLKVAVKTSQALMNKRYSGDGSKKDMHESNIDFLHLCEKSAEYISKRDGWYTVSCECEGKIREIEEIHKEVCKTVEGRIFNET